MQARELQDRDTDVQDPASLRRFRDERAGETVVRIFQGEFYITDEPDEVLSTVLGSCVAVCMRNPETGFGGMNHFLLPSGDSPERDSYSLRYGTYSIERLINAVLSRGGEREALEVKVFGGANILKGMVPIGSHNVEFVKKYLKKEGLTVSAHHLGGEIARRIRYYPKTGRVMMGRISSEIISIGQQEVELSGKDLLGPTAGKTVLFRRN